MKSIITPFVIILVLILPLLFSYSTTAQDFTVAFYNVENLFDTVDDPATEDSEFLPAAEVPWTMERYRAKLKQLAKVLSSINGESLPAIIGLCEVENSRVLEDLVGEKALKKGKYHFVHYDSPDERGIDNAMLYDRQEFRVLQSMAIPVRLTAEAGDVTRDILYVKGLVKKSPEDTLHIFINHWPSRRGGKEASEINRIDAARTLRAQVDSLFSISPWANIIILGDFNDEPYDRSISEVLGAFTPTYNPETDVRLYNMMTPAYHDGRGTLYYDRWQVFDQIILSTHLIIKTTGLTLPEFEGRIFAEEWLLFEAPDGTKRPNRTIGREYYGGYSDHLPVYIDFIIR